MLEGDTDGDMFLSQKTTILYDQLCLLQNDFPLQLNCKLELKRHIFSVEVGAKF